MAAKKEREKAAQCAADAKELREVAKHLDAEARAHVKEAAELVGTSDESA